jgi:hypothetical protein
MWWRLAIGQAAQQLSKEVVAVSRARQLYLPTGCISSREVKVGCRGSGLLLEWPLDRKGEPVSNRVTSVVM